MRDRRIEGQPGTGRSRAVSALVCCAALVGCGSDSVMGPAPVAHNVAGQWAYSAQALSGMVFGSPITCDYDLIMQIPTTGPSFDGQYSQARLVCALNGPPMLVDFGGGDIVAGALDGDSVEFAFEESVLNTGTIDGDRMSGQVSVELVIQVDAQIDTVQVSGVWAAQR